MASVSLWLILLCLLTRENVRICQADFITDLTHFGIEMAKLMNMSIEEVGDVYFRIICNVPIFGSTIACAPNIPMLILTALNIPGSNMLVNHLFSETVRCMRSAHLIVEENPEYELLRMCTLRPSTAILFGICFLPGMVLNIPFNDSGSQMMTCLLNLLRDAIRAVSLGIKNIFIAAPRHSAFRKSLGKSLSDKADSSPNPPERFLSGKQSLAPKPNGTASRNKQSSNQKSVRPVPQPMSGPVIQNFPQQPVNRLLPKDIVQKSVKPSLTETMVQKQISPYLPETMHQKPINQPETMFQKSMKPSSPETMVQKQIRLLSPEIMHQKSNNLPPLPETMFQRPIKPPLPETMIQKQIRPFSPESMYQKPDNLPPLTETMFQRPIKPPLSETIIQKQIRPLSPETMHQKPSNLPLFSEAMFQRAIKPLPETMIQKSINPPLSETILQQIKTQVKAPLPETILPKPLNVPLSQSLANMSPLPQKVLPALVNNSLVQNLPNIPPPQIDSFETIKDFSLAILNAFKMYLPQIAPMIEPQQINNYLGVVNPALIPPISFNIKPQIAVNLQPQIAVNVA